LSKSNFYDSKGGLEKNRGDEPNQDIIHIYMEVPQGNSLYNLEQAKMSFFFSVSFLLQNQRTGA
jgi:hypothetical protein